MWRPKGWDKIKRDACKRTGGFFNQDTPIWIEDDLLLFEAGANAILKAIKEQCDKKEWIFYKVNNGTPIFFLENDNDKGI